MPRMLNTLSPHNGTEAKSDEEQSPRPKNATALLVYFAMGLSNSLAPAIGHSRPRVTDAVEPFPAGLGSSRRAER